MKSVNPLTILVSLALVTAGVIFASPSTADTDAAACDATGYSTCQAYNPHGTNQPRCLEIADEEGEDHCVDCNNDGVYNHRQRFTGSFVCYRPDGTHFDCKVSVVLDGTTCTP